MSGASFHKQVSEVQDSDGEGLDQALLVAKSAFSTSTEGITMGQDFCDAISAATRSQFQGIFVSYDTTTGKVAGAEREEEYRKSPEVELSYLAHDREQRKQGHGSAHVDTHIKRAHDAGYVLSLSADSMDEFESAGLKQFYHAQGMRHVRIAGTVYFHSIWPDVAGSSSTEHVGSLRCANADLDMYSLIGFYEYP